MNNSTEFGTQPGIAEEAAPSSPWPPPRVRFGAGALCFNQGAVNALARAERVTIYVNDNGQMLIVRPSEGNDVPGAEWVHRTGACVRPKAILSSPFVQGLYARMGWRQECDYRAAGTAIQTHTGPILLFAGAGPDTIEDAVIYFQILMISIVFMSLSLTINAAQRGAGNTKISMRTNLAANIVNIILNYLLINGIWVFPKMGVAGAAAATAIGNIVGCIMSVMSLFYHAHFLDFRTKTSWRFDRKTMGALVSISGSAMVEQVFMRIGFFTYAKIVAGLGTVAFATHQICMNIINLSFSFGDGLGVAASSLVGQSLGEKRPDMAIIYGKTGQRMAFCISSALFVFFLLGRHFLMELFTDDARVIALGGIILIIIACTTHVQTAQVVYSGCLRGAGDTKFVALSSFISIGIIRPGLSWILCFPCGLGLVGAWLGLFGDQFLRMIFCMTRFRGGRWTKIEL